MIEDVFRIIKADRYTKDGCDEIQKAKDNLAEDEKYNIGDISKKTGLQKTANGWVEPKKARAGAGKADKQLSKEINNMNHFQEQKKADAKVKRDEKLRIGRQEGEARADDFRKKVESGEIVYNKETGKFEDGNKPTDKWQKTKDYLGRERISMKTPQGGMVSIYETDNPNQKNNRFRVDTGTHADYFNSMEEAKAFAEKHYGPDSKSKAAEPNIHGAEVDKIYERQLKRIKELKAKGFTDEQIDNDKIIKQTKEDMKNVGKQPGAKKEEKEATSTTTAITEWEESAKKDAKAYNENMVILQNEKGETTAVRESSPDVEKAEAHGYKKMSLVRPDGSIKKHDGNAESKPAAGSKPDKVGDFMKAYERGDFGKYQQNAEQKKVESFFSNKDSAPRVLTGDCKIRIRK